MGKFASRLVRVPPSWNSLGRMARTNAAGNLTPTEFAAVTPDGYSVFGQPFVTGRAVSERNAPFALDSVGLKIITQIGGTAAVGQVDDKLILFDDLHGRNVKVAPNGRVEVIDAINRELTPGSESSNGKASQNGGKLSILNYDPLGNWPRAPLGFGTKPYHKVRLIQRYYRSQGASGLAEVARPQISRPIAFLQVPGRGRST